MPEMMLEFVAIGTQNVMRVAEIAKCILLIALFVI